MAVLKRTIVFWVFWIVFQIGLFWAGFFKQKMDPGLATLNRLQWSVWTSRGAGLNLAVTSALLMVPMCRNTMGLLRRTPLGRIIPFDEGIFFHKVCAYTVLFFTVIHTTAHYVNFFNVQLKLPALKLKAWQIHYTTWGGATGHVMAVAMFFMYTAAAMRMRQQSFEAFWFTHHLAIVFYLGFFFHGYGCFVKTADGHCRPYYSWSYALFVCTIYVFERLLRIYRGQQPTTIERVIMHPGNAMEIQFNKPSMAYAPGQWVFINIPEVAPLQWHPFTLTSCPEERYASVHIRLVGDWTKNAARVLGCMDEKSTRDPRSVTLRVDGPYAAPADRAFDYDNVICVAAGIGVTPFASVLKSLGFRARTDPDLILRKVDFFWVNRDKQAFEWFQAELRSLESMLPSHLLQYHLHLTEKLGLDAIHNYCLNAAGADFDPITQLRAQLQFGRPDWEHELAKIRDRVLAANVGVKRKLRIACFFCGPAPVARALRDACIVLSNGQVDLDFFKEHF
ncbi:hypothetical protein GGF31_001876 [Allomyces arbusculus]|nr:hypothetical protein GGF31_001876 [Allomyces arbusculus]